MAQPRHNAPPRHAWLWPNLVVAGVVTACIHGWWLSVDDTPLFWDTARHGINALRVWDLMHAEVPWPQTLAWLYAGPEDYYPPVYSLVAAALMPLTGVDADGMAWASVAFHLVLQLAVCRLALGLFGAGSALLAPWLCLAVPMLFDFGHQVMLDLPLTAMVAVCLWLMDRRPFARPLSAALLGLVMALGFLTKWTHPAFTLLPAVVVFVRDELRPRRPADGVPFLRRWWSAATAARGAWLNGAICTLVGVAVARPWFMMHQRALLGTAESTSHVPNPLALFSLAVPERLYRHLAMSFDHQVDFWSSAMACAGGWLMARSPEARARYAPLASSLLCSCVLWGVFAGHQDVRYSLPQVVPIILAMLAWPALPSGRDDRRWRSLVVAAWCGWSVVNLALAPSALSHPWLQRSRVAAQTGYHAGPPVPGHESNLTAAMLSVAMSGLPPLARFQAQADVPGFDTWAAWYSAMAAGVRLVDGEPLFLLTVEPAADRHALQVRRSLNPHHPITRVWRQPGVACVSHETRSAAAATRFYVQVASETVLLSLEHGTVTDGTVLAGGRTHVVLVRGDTVRVCSASPVALLRSPGPLLAGGEWAALDLGFPFVPAGTPSVTSSPRPTVTGPTSGLVPLLSGPYLALPPGDYVAEVDVAVTGTAEVELSADANPMPPASRANLATTAGSTVRVAFNNQSWRRNAEVPVHASAVASGSCTVTRARLMTSSPDVFGALVGANPRLVRPAVVEVVVPSAAVNPCPAPPPGGGRGIEEPTGPPAPAPGTP